MKPQRPFQVKDLCDLASLLHILTRRNQCWDVWCWVNEKHSWSTARLKKGTEKDSKTGKIKHTRYMNAIHIALVSVSFIPGVGQIYRWPGASLFDFCSNAVVEFIPPIISTYSSWLLTWLIWETIDENSTQLRSGIHADRIWRNITANAYYFNSYLPSRFPVIFTLTDFVFLIIIKKNSLFFHLNQKDFSTRSSMLERNVLFLILCFKPNEMRHNTF